MKKGIVFLIVLFVPVAMFAQGDNGDSGGLLMGFLKDHWLALLIGLLAFAEVVTRLTPTKRDDTILEWIKQIIGVVFPNRKAGGGAFKSHTNK